MGRMARSSVMQSVPISYSRHRTVEAAPLVMQRDAMIARQEEITMPVDPLERLRALCLALPETTERLSHGEPTWFVRDKKTFVMYADNHHDNVLAFWCAAPPGAQELLVSGDPERYFRPPYVGHRGWLGVRLEGE